MARNHGTIQFRKMGVGDKDGPIIQHGPFDVVEWDGQAIEKALIAYRTLSLADPEIYAVCVIDEAGERIFRWDTAHEIIWQEQEAKRIFRENRLLEKSWEGEGKPFHVFAPSKMGDAKSKDFEQLNDAFEEAVQWEGSGLSDVVVKNSQDVSIPRPPMPAKAR